MGQTKKRNYDRYTLAFKLQAVKLENHPNVKSRDITDVGYSSRDVMSLVDGTMHKPQNYRKGNPSFLLREATGLLVASHKVVRVAI